MNTGDWEYRPSLSGGLLLFARLDQRNGDRDVIVYDLSTGDSTTIASSSGWRRLLEPGQISGTFVVWGRVTLREGLAVSCNVFTRDLAKGTTVQIPNPDSRCQYASSVDAVGNVYFASGDVGCGQDVVLMRYGLDGTVETVETLPDGYDLSDTYAFDNGEGTTSVYLDPGRCNRHGAAPNQDIERVVISY